MKILKGFLAFLDDGRRFLIWFVKRPSVVALFLCVFFGAFYAAGIKPDKIGDWIKGKAMPAVGQRIDNLKANADGMSNKAVQKLAENGVMLPRKQVRPAEPLKAVPAIESGSAEIAVPRDAEKQAAEKNEAAEERRRQNAVEAVSWAQLMSNSRSKDALAGVNPSKIVQGTVTVVGADRIKIGGKTYKLNVKIRAGKAGEAFQTLLKNVDASTVRCAVEDANATCYFNNVDITEVLRDRLLAD